MNHLGIFTLTSRCKQPASQLNGYAFTSNCLLLGTNGYKAYRKSNQPLGVGNFSGRFSLLESTPSQTVIQSDNAGQEVIFYGEFEGFWVVSNSLLAATEAMRTHQVDVVPYLPAIHAFKVGNGSLTGGQLISLNTPVKGVKVLPAGYAICVSYAGSATPRSKEPSLRLVSQPTTQDYTSYQDYITHLTAQLSAQAKVMASLDAFATMSLSGGVDSRMCLALLSNQNSPLEHLFCYSHPHVENEFNIATNLASLTRAHISDKRASKQVETTKLSGHSRYKLAMYGNAGVNANFGFRANIPAELKTAITGGSVVGTVSMQRDINQRRQLYQHQLGSLGDEVADEYASSLNHIGLSADNPVMAMHHYAQLRARIHYGLNWYKALGSLQVHPLMNASLLAAQDYVSLDYIAGNGVNRDIIKIANHALLEIPFDSIGKIKATHSLAKAGPLPEVKYTIYGKINDLNSTTEDVSAYNKACGSKASFKTIFERQHEPMEALARHFDFDDSFISQAKIELQSSRRVRRAGILLGLHSLFTS